MAAVGQDVGTARACGHLSGSVQEGESLVFQSLCGSPFWCHHLSLENHASKPRSLRCLYFRSATAPGSSIRPDLACIEAEVEPYYARIGFCPLRLYPFLLPLLPYSIVFYPPWGVSYRYWLLFDFVMFSKVGVGLGRERILSNVQILVCACTGETLPEKRFSVYWFV